MKGSNRIDVGDETVTIELYNHGVAIMIESKEPAKFTRLWMTPGELDALIGALLIAEDALAEASEVEA